MSLLRFEKLSIRFGDQMILDAADLALEPRERVCLIGRNGAGKSTTFRLITGELEPDAGEVVGRSGLSVSQLAQNLPEAMDRSVRDVVRDGLASTLALVEEFQALSDGEPDAAGLARLEVLQREIDATDG